MFSYRSRCQTVSVEPRDFISTWRNDLILLLAQIRGGRGVRRLWEGLSPQWRPWLSQVVKSPFSQYFKTPPNMSVVSFSSERRRLSRCLHEGSVATLLFNILGQVASGRRLSPYQLQALIDASIVGWVYKW